MSHDLRTPLTVLTGYLEILKLEEGRSEKQTKYLQAASEKALQIKWLSDRLFEYFLVEQQADTEAVMEDMSVADFLEGVMEPALFDLESENMQVIKKIGILQGQLRIRPDMLHRVFYNMVSNLLKYADRRVPVEIDVRCNATELRIRWENAVGPPNSTDSNGVGLPNCQKILAAHQGTCSWTQSDRFCVSLTLPLTESLRSDAGSVR